LAHKYTALKALFHSSKFIGLDYNSASLQILFQNALMCQYQSNLPFAKIQII